MHLAPKFMEIISTQKKISIKETKLMPNFPRSKNNKTYIYRPVSQCGATDHGQNFLKHLSRVYTIDYSIYKGVYKIKKVEKNTKCHHSHSNTLT